MMVYMGDELRSEWLFNLPAKNASYARVKAGAEYQVEIIDLWNMTITEVPRRFEVGVAVDYRHYDVSNGKVRLPLLPYIVLRIKEIKAK